MRPPRDTLRIAGLCAVLLTLLGACRTPAPQTARVVVITGEDYAGHDWRATGPALRDELARDPRLSVDLVEDVRFTGATALHDYDVVVLHFKNYDPTVPGRAAFDNLCRFVEDGGGLVSVHFGCGAFEEFQADFEQLIGRTWFGINERTKGWSHHDPYGAFRVAFVDRDHPAVAGLDDFDTTDELYTCLEGSAPIHLLADAHSKVKDERHPQIYVREVGDGRVFVSTLGHDVAALTNPGTAECYRRGTAWAAGLQALPKGPAPR
jgi:type 1 glutamine amidotransferase